jgi:DNA-binding LytR/AlgR family response regulator
MKMLEDELPTNLFMRIHHSYIIALSEIEVVHKTEVKIGDNWIPISETYKKNLKDYIDRNHIQSHGENL